MLDEQKVKMNLGYPTDLVYGGSKTMSIINMPGIGLMCGDCKIHFPLNWNVDKVMQEHKESDCFKNKEYK